MRVIRLSTNPHLYLKEFYNNCYPNFHEETYKVQYEGLMSDSFGWADFWTKALGRLGYEVWEPVGNAEPMQKAWAKENGVPHDHKNWLLDITTMQVQHFKPDIIFVNDYTTYDAGFFANLKSICPSIQLIIGWCGAPYQDASVFKAYDLVLSNIPSLVAHFREGGHRCEHMNHAFEARILDRVHSSSGKITQFSFIGSVVKGNGFHNQREQLLKKLLDETPLEIWTNTIKPSIRERLFLPLRQAIYDFTQTTKHVPSIHSTIRHVPKIRDYVNLNKRPNLDYQIDPYIASRSKPALYGLSMYQQLYQSKCTLNTHIDLSAKFASNMRLFEATGIGTCLLTELQDNLPLLFKPDTEVVTYQCADEAVEKVLYLLKNDNEQKKIAEAGKRRTLKDHTFDIRAQQMDQLIYDYLRK